MRLSRNKTEATIGILIQALEAMLCNRCCFMKLTNGETPTEDETYIAAALLDLVPASISAVVAQLLEQAPNVELSHQQQAVLRYWLEQAKEIKSSNANDN